MRIVRVTTISILVALAAAACAQKGDGEGTSAKAAPSASASQPASPPAASAGGEAPAAAAPTQKVELELTSVANTMAFDKTKLSVPAGAEVHLVFHNKSTMKTLPHNWVLVQPGTQAKVAADGLAKAPDSGWIVEGDNVLAHTPLAQAGETTEVTFKAPAPGTYPYICTVPGHYMMMKGTLTVTP